MPVDLSMTRYWSYARPLIEARRLMSMTFHERKAERIAKRASEDSTDGK